MSPVELRKTARELVALGKGILAADESTPTITRRFEGIDLESTEETRRAYREMLFTTPGLGDFISGIILYEETLHQQTRAGVGFVDLLNQAGIIPGIKVDKGARNLARFPGEKITEGLDGLRERFAEFSAAGARFAKWRAVFQITDCTPTPQGIAANAHALARYASLSQETGLVPIVEPEVLMKGTHRIERCEEVTEMVLSLVFEQLRAYRVQLDQMLLKPNMVTAGEECPNPAGVNEVAVRTMRCLRRAVPAAVPGIVFLSGGQSPTLATEHLNRLNQLGDAPWELSFSFGRALQAPALTAWRGSNPTSAQQALRHRAQCNSAARSGHYRPTDETRAALAA